MISLVLLCALWEASVVKSERLVPKDASYGYVPRETEVDKYSSELQQPWRPYAARDQHFDNSPAAKTTPQNRTLPPGQSTNKSENKTVEILPQSRSLKSARFPGEPYYYEPPGPHYLPPSSDPYPSDFTTLGPTEEEFVNRPPPRDEIPDVPSQGYDYSRPEQPQDGLQPPFSNDEPFPVTPTNHYLPIPSADTPDYSAPSYGVIIAKTISSKSNYGGGYEDAVVVDARQIKQRGPLQIEVTEMHCFDTPNDGRFQVVLTVKTPSENVPSFEDASQSDFSSCLVRSDSNPPRVNSKLRINLSKSQFSACGVRDCSLSGDVVHLCVKLRFPTIPRMRLAEDPVLTLQCRTQDRIAAHTKHLQLDVDNAVSGRSSSVARGGARGGLRSRVGLYRRGPRGDYGEALPPRARVTLGELLMLKADVEPDDGWVSSRLSSVSLARGGSGGGSPLALLGLDGCRSGQARALCPREPRTTSPLGHTLLIRAALFEGMRSGEEVRLSVRLMACLEAADCRAPRCLGIPSTRQRRSAPASANISNSTSELSFSVVLPSEDAGEVLEPREASSAPGKGPLVAMLLVFSASVACAAALTFLKPGGRPRASSHAHGAH